MTEEEFAFVGGEQLDTETAYRLLIGSVVPRPIAWITTLNEHGLVNVAPFSSYNYVATSPPMLAMNIALRAKDGAIKDTARNIARSGEFVVNVATRANLDLIHKSGEEFGPDVSEAEVLGLELLPSRFVSVPRLAIAPIHMECKLDQMVTLGKGINTLYIGEVVAFHLHRGVYDGRRVDGARLDPISRMGGPNYGVIGELIELQMIQKPPGGEGSDK